MIEVYDPTLVTKQGEITAIIKGAKYERINADKTLNFEVALSTAITALINAVNVIKLDSDYYDIASYSKGESGGRTPTVNVECEHVSCRLNDSDYDVEYFTETGTPTQILTAILADTGFTVGTVEFATPAAYSLQQETSRRNLLMQYAASLGAELDFNGFAVSLLTQRGSATPKDLTANKNLTMLSMSVDKRTLDSLGNPTVSYSCSIYDPVETLALGDAVTLEYALLGINVTLRIVGISIHPYDAKQVVIEVGNYINALEDDIYRIETAKVSKDKLLNGIRIGEEYGFEAVRNDKKARAYFRSDGFAMQSGDGSGNNWINRIYFDPESGKYKFVGTIEVDSGSLNIDDNFVVAEDGTVTIKKGSISIGGNFVIDDDGNARLSGAATIYGGRFYAGTPNNPLGFVEMRSNGFRLYGEGGIQKAGIEIDPADVDYPFFILGAGDGEPGTQGVFKKFLDGLWVGNSAPLSANGNFVPTAGYNGIFFDFSDNQAYVVNGTNIQNIYTGEAIAKFGG